MGIRISPRLRPDNEGMSNAKEKALHERVKRSKFDIRDRHPGAKRLNFIPKRRETLFDKKEPTHEQFFRDIKHTGNIDIYYKGRKIASRGM